MGNQGIRMTRNNKTSERMCDVEENKQIVMQISTRNYEQLLGIL